MNINYLVSINSAMHFFKNFDYSSIIGTQPVFDWNVYWFIFDMKIIYYKKMSTKLWVTKVLLWQRGPPTYSLHWNVNLVFKIIV